MRTFITRLKVEWLLFSVGHKFCTVRTALLWCKRRNRRNWNFCLEKRFLKFSFTETGAKNVIESDRKFCHNLQILSRSTFCFYSLLVLTLFTVYFLPALDKGPVTNAQSTISICLKKEILFTLFTVLVTIIVYFPGNEKQYKMKLHYRHIGLISMATLLEFYKLLLQTQKFRQNTARF